MYSEEGDKDVKEKGEKNELDDDSDDKFREL
jgi:hypothetical protein